MFKRTEAGLVQARKDLSRALSSTLDSGGDPVTATRIWFESSIPAGELADPTSEHDLSVDSEEDAPGFLELLAETEDGNQSLVQTMAAASSIAEDITSIYAEATADTLEADARGGGASARLVIANRTALKLEKPASRMEVVSGDYERTVQRIEPGLRYLADRLTADPSQLKEAPEFPDAVRKLSVAARGIADGATSMCQNATEIGKASKSLRRVGQRLASSFAKIASVSARLSEWGKLVDQLPTKADDSQ